MTQTLARDDMHAQFIKLLSRGSERHVADLTVAAIGRDEERFNTVLGICFTEKYPLCMRAARVIQLYCANDTEFLMKDFENTMVRALAARVDGVKRNFIKIFSDYLDFSLIRESGLLLNRCFDIVMDPAEKPAGRIYSMRILLKFAEEEESIAGELEETLKFLDEETTPSFISARKRALKKLHSMKRAKSRGY